MKASALMHFEYLLRNQYSNSLDMVKTKNGRIKPRPRTPVTSKNGFRLTLDPSWIRRAPCTAFGDFGEDAQVSALQIFSGPPREQHNAPAKLIYMNATIDDDCENIAMQQRILS